MGIGASIFLIAVGAILAFAVDYHVSGIDIAVIGWILMLVGALGMAATLAIWAPRRSRGPRERRERRRPFAAEDHPPPVAPAGEAVEYYAGVDPSGRERWVVGRVERRERRADGEWLYMRPTQPGPSARQPEPAWVAAEQTRTMPAYDPRNGYPR
ncbi:DUF6458 family protein [Actinopolymorpha sp. B9G3]|uniref:DUF6458 family protein n=1 Tax=Actinopolymorpha sp. B9G3 TaxID=3158970 RepID=UPI0032D90A3C